MTFRILLLLLATSLITSSPASAGNFIDTRGRASSWPICKNEIGGPRQTIFTPERSVQFRERNGSRSHFETADNILRGGSIDHCGFSNNAHRSQDQAQSMVAADLLSRAKEIALTTQERALKDIQALKACANKPASASECRLYHEKVLPELEREFSLMRVLRAISQAEPGPACNAEAGRLANPASRDAAVSSMFSQGSSACFAASEISHDVPFLSSLFGGSATPKALAALSSSEQALIQKIYRERGGDIFSGGQARTNRNARNGSNGNWSSFKEAAQADYERLLIKYPIFNYLEGQSLRDSDLRGAFDQVEANAQSQVDRIKNAAPTDIGTYDGALAQAISEVPEDMRGDYCHIANQMDDDLGKRRLGKTMLFIGAGLATMGMGLIPATAAGAATEGLMAYSSLNEYSYQSLRCQSGADGSPNCSPDRLRDARDNLYSPTEGALFLAGGVVDAAGAVRYLMKGGNAIDALPTTGLGSTTTEASSVDTAVIAGAAGTRNVETPAEAFSPLTRPSQVKSSAVDQADLAVRRDLSKMGVAVTPITDPNRGTYLADAEKYGWYDPKITPRADGTKAYGALYRVDRLPPVGRASPFAPALSHPEMAEYLRKMRAQGYELVIDSSLKHTGAGAYFYEKNKVIALAPNSTWQTFLHEYQHLEFSNSLLRYNFVEPIVALRQSGKDLQTSLHPAVVAEIGADKVAKIQRLIDRGITPSNAINESLSVGRELEALGWRKFVPGSGAIPSYQYMLRHQITDLEALGPKMTDQQRRLVTQLKLQHHAAGAAIPALGLGAAFGAGAGGMILYSHLSQNYTEIYYDNNGNMIGVKPDGSRVYIKVRSN